MEKIYMTLLFSTIIQKINMSNEKIENKKIKPFEVLTLAFDAVLLLVADKFSIKTISNSEALNLFD